MNNMKFLDECANYTAIMNEALTRGNFEAYEAARDMLDESVSAERRNMRLAQELDTTNFGVLNHIFENELPRLLKSNKGAVKNVIKTIKGDNNLVNEFAFYNMVKNGYKNGQSSSVDASRLLESISAIATQKIDLKTVSASNAKLRDVMKENNILPSNLVDEENRKLYEACDKLLTTKKTTTNMLPLMESFDKICSYMDSHKDIVSSQSKDIDSIVEEFEQNMRMNLNEDEISFVKQITDFKSPLAEQRKERLFNKLKDDCVKKVDEMIDKGEDVQGLSELKHKIESISFNNETIVKDVAKLLEIRDILNK